jgi:hypothetical protein
MSEDMSKELVNISTRIINRMNQITEGPLYAVSYKERWESVECPGFAVQIVVNAREGATADMIRETRSHYLAMAKAVYEGRSLDSAGDNAQRSEYPRPAGSHNDHRVNIWGDVQVKTGDKLVVLSVNQFSEYTTAYGMVNHLYEVAETVKHPVVPMTISTPAARQTLGSGGDRRVGTSTPAPQASDESASGTPHFEQFPQSAEARTAFGEQYGGKVVSFTARKIEKKFHAEPDENGQPQMEWHFYEVPTHQYPMVRSTLAFIRDEATKTYLPKLPNTIEGEWRVVCYVNKKDTGKVYFNINKVEPVSVPHGDLSDKPALSTADQFAADYNLTTDDAPSVETSIDDAPF